MKFNNLQSLNSPSIFFKHHIFWKEITFDKIVKRPIIVEKIQGFHHDYDCIWKQCLKILHSQKKIIFSFNVMFIFCIFTNLDVQIQFLLSVQIMMCWRKMIFVCDLLIEKRLLPLVFQFQKISYSYHFRTYQYLGGVIHN